MVEFESLFRESRGKPILYHGETLLLMDRIPVPERCRLSVERAQVVKAYLVKKGVPSNQIFCKGMADQRPVGDNLTSDGRALNRRVEVVITHNADNNYNYNYSTPPASRSYSTPQYQEPENYGGNSNMIE